MPELILPATRLHAAFLECRDDWGPGVHEDGFGLGADDDVDSSNGFATMPGTPQRPCSCSWAFPNVP